MDHSTFGSTQSFSSSFQYQIYTASYLKIGMVTFIGPSGYPQNSSSRAKKAVGVEYLICAAGFPGLIGRRENW